MLTCVACAPVFLRPCLPQPIGLERTADSSALPDGIAEAEAAEAAVRAATEGGIEGSVEGTAMDDEAALGAEAAALAESGMGMGATHVWQ